MAKRIKEIFMQIQNSAGNLQKYERLLLKHYKNVRFEYFSDTFLECLLLVFQEDFTEKNVKVDRCLTFAANFCIHLIEDYMKEYGDISKDEMPTHPFILRIINGVLKYHNLSYINIRYHVCHFMALIFKNIGNNTYLDNDICDMIQNALLERIQDVKYHIRQKAVNGLVRFQDINNSECPVIKAFIKCLMDPVAMIRKEVVTNIAVSHITLPKIIFKVRDVDRSVRMATYKKYSFISPKALKINERQSILLSGFNEEDPRLQSVVHETLMPKWLCAYDNDILKLLHALRLDADENDFQQTAKITKLVLEEYFRNSPIKEVIDVLLLNDEKLVPVEKINNDVITYWRLLVNYLQNSKETECLEQVIPELMLFCKHIEQFIEEKTAKTMEPWVFLDFQHMLRQLFAIAGSGDLTDEMGRTTLKGLILNTLRKHTLDVRTVNEIIVLLHKINTNMESLATEICEIVENIRTVPVKVVKSPRKQQNQDFMIAQLRMKMHLLQDEQENAVAKKEFIKASNVQKELQEIEDKLAQISAPEEEILTENVKLRDDYETLSRCIDLLIGVLNLPTLKTLPSSLKAFLDQCLEPIINNCSPIYEKVFKYIVLCGIVEKPLAEKYMKMICSPIICYRILPEYNKEVLMTAIATICDILLCYGIGILGENSQRLQRTRKLYEIQDLDDIASIDLENISVGDIIDIMTDILDDESEELREQVGLALIKLTYNNVIVSPSVVSKLILKWFNPLSAKQDVRLQQYLGKGIVDYASKITGNEEILEQAVIIVLVSMANAPKTSPLFDIDIENALNFLACITSFKKQKNEVNIHKNLATAIVAKMSSKPNNCVFQLLVRMLLKLDPPFDEATAISDLKTQTEFLFEVVKEKSLIRNLEKYVRKLSNRPVSEYNSTRASSLPNNTASVLNIEEKIDQLPESDPNSTELNRLDENDPNKINENSDDGEKNGKRTKKTNNLNGNKRTKLQLKQLPAIEEKSQSNTSKDTESLENLFQTAKSNSDEVTENQPWKKTTKRRKRRGIKQTNNGVLSKSSSENSRNSSNSIVIETATSSSGASVKSLNQKTVISETSSDSDVPQQKLLRRSNRKR